MWMYVAKGVKGIFHWQYHTEMIGTEAPNYGLLKPDSTPRQAYHVMNRVYGEIERHKEVLEKSQAPQARVAILFSPESYLVYWNLETNSDRARACLTGTYVALYKYVDAIDILHPKDIGEKDLNQGRLIFLPYPLMLTRRVSRCLARFVEHGGFLVTEACCAMRDDRTDYQRIVPGDGLDKMFGCRQDELQMISQPPGEVAGSSSQKALGEGGP